MNKRTVENFRFGRSMKSNSRVEIYTLYNGQKQKVIIRILMKLSIHNLYNWHSYSRLFMAKLAEKVEKKETENVIPSIPTNFRIVMKEKSLGLSWKFYLKQKRSHQSYQFKICKSTCIAYNFEGLQPRMDRIVFMRWLCTHCNFFSFHFT